MTRRPLDPDPRRNFGRESPMVTGERPMNHRDPTRRICAHPPTFPLQELHAMDSDPPPVILTDAITAPVYVIPKWRVAVAALLTALAFFVLTVCAVVGSSGCSAAQRTDAMTYARHVVTVAKEFAKATCRAVETPGAQELASIVVPGVATPLTFSAARLVCAIFINNPDAAAVSVEQIDSAAPASSGGE